MSKPASDKCDWSNDEMDIAEALFRLERQHREMGLTLSQLHEKLDRSRTIRGMRCLTEGEVKALGGPGTK